MTVSTDDSKIHSATLKQEKTEIENGNAVPEKDYKNVNCPETYQIKGSENGSEVYRAHKKENLKASAEKSTSDNVFTKETTPQDTQSPLPNKSKENSVAQAQVVKKYNFVADNQKKQTVQTKGASSIPEQPIKGAEGTSKDHASTMKSDRKRTLRDLQGVHTIIILDISASMAEENAWTHASRFVLDYLNGLEEISNRYELSNEHVALVTFGHDTRVQQRFTKDYKRIWQLVENQRLGGPSPLDEGLALAMATARSSRQYVEKVNQVAVFHKVIIVTDGFITEVSQHEGPDKAVGDLSETKAMLLQTMEEFKCIQTDMYYVQAGKGSEETRQFSELLMAEVGGKILDYKSGRQFSRRIYLTPNIPESFGLVLMSQFGGGRQSFGDFSQEDRFIKIMIEEVQSDVRKSLITRMHTNQSTNKYGEKSGSNLPPAGGRVRRVQVVEYDHDGKDWTNSKGNAQNRHRGVVTRVAGPKATVRWDDGERGDYTYSGTGKCVIEVCSGFRAFGLEGHVLGSDFTEPQPDQKKKNKNKNVK
ncbi:uncharacterized protein LOC132732226 [Ruditapes philippinarum]|uniref:uncharacterized protein LOC132732226 n=1 Tax=Ruditapes philippinarum TaxID=129788 RepID=UPI00295BC213|nr:uncharacterized protein LOC132732226 [Ruditapes philippinarum]